MSTRTETQEKAVLRYLLQHGSITAVEAYNLCGTMRLASRVFNLKEDGYDIYTERVPILDDNGKEVGHYGRYHLRGVPMAHENG